MTRTGWFIYNGFDTRSLGLTVVPGDIDSAPARNFLVHAHGGANGDFVVDTGRFDNVPRTYTIMIRGNFRATYDALCNALLPMKGYRRLTDMWAPDEYFMAYLSAPLEPTVSPDEDRGTVLVSFTRQPQRWLLNNKTVTIRTGRVYGNTSPFAAYLTVESTGLTSELLSNWNQSWFLAFSARIGDRHWYIYALYFHDIDTLKSSLEGATSIFWNMSAMEVYTDTGVSLSQYVSRSVADLFVAVPAGGTFAFTLYGRMAELFPVHRYTLNEYTI